MSNVVKFPYSVSRRAHARNAPGFEKRNVGRKGRESRNGAGERPQIRRASDSFRDFVEHLSQLTAQEFPDFIARLRKGQAWTKSKKRGAGLRSRA